MKHARICISGTASAVVLAGCLFPAFALCRAPEGKIEPTGTNIGVVQFDTVIELDRYSAHSLRHDYTVIFARYWVAREYYSVAVVWAEPQSTDLVLALHPPSLSITSTERGFNICHDSFEKYDQTYKKPLGRREVFRYKFGSYPIGNVRFGEQEGLAARIYSDDLKAFEDPNQAGANELQVTVPPSDDTGTRAVTGLKVQATANRIKSLQLFDAEQRLLKSISYHYEGNDGRTCLRKLTAVLPQRPMMVGFTGEGIKVTLDGEEYRYRELDATHHAGGRRCTVEYDLVTFGSKDVPLPVRVMVRGGKDDRILRSVQLMNFKKVELDVAGVKNAARQFAAVGPHERLYEQLRLKYWKKAPDQIESPDLEVIKHLRDRFQKQVAAPNRCTGEGLKYFNVLMELSMMCGDSPELEHNYRKYLGTLAQNGLRQMTLVGGYGVIESAMFADRRSEAAMLLEQWVDTALPMNDAESILLFAKRQLAKKRFWTTCGLLERFSAKCNLDANLRFEAEALRCKSLHELYRLMLQPDTIKGLSAETEAHWVRSRTGPGGLEKLLTDSVNRAKQVFEGLPLPTESQYAMKTQLDQIEKQVSQPERNSDG